MPTKHQANNKPQKKSKVKPPQKKAAKPKNRSQPKGRRTTQVHPMAIYSPFHSRGHVPTAHPHTESVPIDSILNGQYAHSGGYEYIYLLSWTPTTYLASIFYSKADQSVNPVGGFVWAGQQLGATIGAQPLTIKPLRLGMRIKNVSPILSLAGVCYACPVNAPLPIVFGEDNVGNSSVKLSLADFNGLKNHIVNNRNVQTIGATQLEKRTFVCVPNSEVDYERFYDFNEGPVGDNLDNLMWETSYNQIQYATPMTQWLLYFPTTTVEQQYAYTIRRTDACKYPILSALQNTATVPPRISTDQHRLLNRTAAQMALRDEGSQHETFGQRMLHAGESALGNLGAGLIKGAEWFGKNAIIRGGARLARGLGWAAEEAGPLALAAL